MSIRTTLFLASALAAAVTACAAAGMTAFAQTSGTGGTVLPDPCTVLPQGTFRGCYYQGKNFDNRKVVRDDPAIDFDWSGDAPSLSIHSDVYSVRWQGQFTFESAVYQFHVIADDGVRVYLDGNLVLDKWVDQPATEFDVVRTLSEGLHTVKVEYYNDGGQAVAKVYWMKEETITSTGSVIYPGACTALTPTDTAWHTCFYQGQSFANPVAFRLNEPINYDWGAKAPDPAITSGTFSLGSQKYEYFGSGGQYRFTATAAGSYRLWVGDNIVLDKWADQTGGTATALVDIPRGTYPITVRLEYSGHVGSAMMKLSWSPAGPKLACKQYQKRSNKCLVPG